MGAARGYRKVVSSRGRAAQLLVVSVLYSIAGNHGAAKGEALGTEAAWLANAMLSYTAATEVFFNRPDEKGGILLSTVHAKGAGRLLRRLSNGYVATCSGVMISPRHFLTAAHCFCERRGGLDHYATWDTCEASGAPTKAETIVLLPGAGAFTAGRAPVLSPKFDVRKEEHGRGTQIGDIAVIELDEIVPVAPVRYSALSADPTDFIAVGFGHLALRPSGAAALGLDADEYKEGIGTVAFLKMQPCSTSIDDARCAFFAYRARSAGVSRAGNCIGDSGGPLLARSAVGDQALVGVTSARASFRGNDCRYEDSIEAIYTDLAPHRAWLDGIIGEAKQQPDLPPSICREVVLKTPGEVWHQVKPNETVRLTVTAASRGDVDEEQRVRLIVQPLSQCKSVFNRVDIVNCSLNGPSDLKIQAQGRGLLQITACTQSSLR